ncbi:MAG: PQQ-dependent sugar dehydrogenase [Anaerolineae bacterium]|nr:PQQ-dependent sugar dehydrogenase [Anaerolineae bacterium]
MMGESSVKRAAMAALVMALTVTAVAALIVWQPDAGRAQGAAESQQTPYQLVPVASGFSRPLYVTHAGDGSGRLFVVEQSGAIRVIKDGAALRQPFLDVSGLISRQALEDNYTERGLLGLAFHPNYAENGLFYINYTDLNGHSVISRYTISADDPDRADATSAAPLLYVEQPYANHNGGHMAFGPDGYLYISLGDGGSGGDPLGSGQNLSTLLGKILRIDVDVPDGYAIPADNPFVEREGARPEIWAWGLRNVWRFSFDRATGDLYLADVGQNQWEEINFQPAGSAGGENYGWNAFEGTHVYSGQRAASDVVPPVLEYDHSVGRCSVTGGYVYRGERIPALQGVYLYGDWCSGTIWSAQRGARGLWQAVVSLESGRNISSFGEDEAGELYLVDYGGAVLRFEPAAGG